MSEAELKRRLARLSLEQKVRLLTGADFWSLYPEPAAGLRRMVLSDGPAGVRGETWDERKPLLPFGHGTGSATLPLTATTEKGASG